MAIKKARPKTNQNPIVTENPDAVYVVSYSRFSSEQQKEISIEAQQDAIHKYCKKHGYICLKDYADRAISGLTDQRPEFQQMIHDAIADPRVTKVIVHKMDRFSRHNAHFPQYLNKLSDKGVKLVSVSEYFDDTPIGIYMRDSTISMNGLYTNNLKQEVMKVLKLKASKAERTGGRPPYGYGFLGEKLAIKPREARAVKLMFQMVDCGFSYKKITDTLYSNGYRSRSADGKFKKATIKEMLENEKYMGTFTYNKANGKDSERRRTKYMAKKPEEIIRVKGGCPAIVDEALFWRVQERLSNRASSSRGKKYYYPLSDNGLMVCQYCGKKMSGNFKKAGRNEMPYATYVCNRHRDKGCPTKDIQTKYVDDFVLEYLQGLLFHTEMKPYLLSLLQESVNTGTKEDKEMIAACKEEVEVKTKEIKKWMRVATKMDEVTPEIRETMSALNKERNNLNEQISLLKEKKKRRDFSMKDIDRLEDMFIDYLKNKDTIATRQFLREMIEKITVGEEEIEVVLNIA